MPMASYRAIGAAQTIPVAGDVETNVAEHVRLATLAGAMSARVLAFPELSLTGYEMSLPHEAALTLDDPRLLPLQDAARSLGITLLVGAPLRLRAKLYIAAFILGADGRAQVYTKHHLGTFPPSASVDGTVPPGEPTVFTEGNLNPLLDLDGHRAALAICADANRPSHAEDAAARGADTYLVSAFVIPSEFAEATENLRMRAQRQRMAVAFSNYGGATGGMATAGQTSFWSENGELLQRLEPQGRAVLVATEHERGWHVETECC
jgi:predicted amidohydrolase